MKRDRRNEGRDDRMSRRDLFRAAAAVAAAPLVQSAANAAQRPPVAEDAGTLEASWRQAPATRRPILLQGGTIVSVDAKVGDFARGDVLIEGTKIVGVGASGRIKAPSQAQVIDATNTIIIPGFVDAH